jgi:hypothetical protein
MTVDPRSTDPANDTDTDLVTDTDTDEDFVDEFGDFEDDEDLEDVLQALGLPDRMAPLWLPGIAELAAVARESVLLRRVGELVAWVGERRQVTGEGDLTEADAAEAAERLGTTQAELLLCWEVALAADLVVVSEDETADANPDLWPTDDDEEDLGTWAIAFTQVLQSLVIDAEVAEENVLEFDTAGALVLPLVLSRSLGVPVAELQEIARDVETEHLEEHEAGAVWDRWVAEHGDPVTTLLARLAEHGAVEVDEETARLTPLGMLIMRDELVEGGIEIPLLPPPDEMTAEDLLTVVGGVTTEELAELSEAWLARRDHEKAAAELLAAAVLAGPAGRFYATSFLADLPATQWSTVLDEPTMRPYALAALGQEHEPADVAWLMLDALSASADILGELDPDAVEIVAAQALPAEHAEEILDAAWRLPHPLTHDVLSLIGAHHSDKKIAKAARTAAHKAKSAS